MSADFWFQTTGGGVDPGWIGSSLRFRNTGSSANFRLRLSSTQMPANNAKDRTRWTLSVWTKELKNVLDTAAQGTILGNHYRTSDSGYHAIFTGKANGDRPGVTYISGGGTRYVSAGKVLRDGTAWQHHVINAEAGTVRWYVNGELFDTITGFSSSWWFAPRPGAFQKMIGCGGNSSAQYWAGFRGFMSEFRFVEGTRMDPTIFGGFDANGIWVTQEPSAVTANILANGGWGNGYYLDFSDPNNIGADRSGNGLNFAAEGFNLTDPNSPDYDWSKDSPTNNMGTFNTQNWKRGYGSGGPVRYGGNQFGRTSGSSGYDFAGSNIVFSSNDPDGYYFEATNVTGQGNAGIGFILADKPCAQYDHQVHVGTSTNASYGITYQPVGYIRNFGTTLNSGLANQWNTAGATARIAIKGNRIWFGNSAGWYNGGNPATGANPTITLSATQNFLFHANTEGANGNYWMECNTGNRPFRYTVPTGFKTLATSDLPAPSLPSTITGSFTGNGNADGPFIHTGCLPGRVQYGSVNVTYGNRNSQTDVDFCASGFKIRSTTSNSGNVSYTVTTTHSDGPHSGTQVPFGGKGVSPCPAPTN